MLPRASNSVWAFDYFCYPQTSRATVQKRQATGAHCPTKPDVLHSLGKRRTRLVASTPTYLELIRHCTRQPEASAQPVRLRRSGCHDSRERLLACIRGRLDPTLGK